MSWEPDRKALLATEPLHGRTRQGSAAGSGGAAVNDDATEGGRLRTAGVAVHLLVDERIESTTSHTPAKKQPTTKYAVKSVSGLMRHQPFYSRTVGHETKAIRWPVVTAVSSPSPEMP